ncbi:MAG: DNA repair protein RecN, partial [Gammaproteobacteria bacterium]|nr:DNA repair protein RecN [Gammaproteobacteria bacterium]
MLTRLHIRNFAIVEQLELEFAPGMTVFTGETGAGKSILLEALGLLLGDRAEQTLIRGNCEACEVTGAFQLPGTPALAALLETQAVDVGGGEILIRRVVGRDGRSRAFLNGSSAPVSVLRSVGEFLVDIHGQGEHQSLLRRDVQRGVLDEYGGHRAELDATAAACADWAAATEQLQSLSAAGPDRDAQLALLRYQVEELEAERVRQDEFESLDAEHRRLANAARLLETLQQVASGLYEGEVASQAQTGRAVRELQDLERFDARLAAIRSLLETALIQIDEAAAELRHYLERLELDPARLNEVEQRLDRLHDLARKHRVTPQQLPAHLESLKSTLQAMTDSGERVGALREEQAQAAARFAIAARALHKRRLEAAASLAGDLTRQVRELGMPGAGFVIDVSEMPEQAPMAHGIDQVEFFVTVNPGQPPRPLSKVASGGELSRISLAIQVIGSRDAGTPTLIFDEVDAGIGGATAEIVGGLLHRLAGRRQILCVTHLPQVAAQGDNHFQVQKSTTRNSTCTQVASLETQDRVEEIARMLGGLKISEQTRA